MSPAVSNPGDIRSIAVSAEDLVAAVETNRTSDREAVLRVTPPFSGRMRARLHVRLGEEATDDGVIVVDPETFLDSDAPAYPRPAETEDELRDDPDAEYSVETHRKRHERAVERWRATLTESIRDAVTLETTTGRYDVDVYVLGSRPSN
jgi:hypothetical protein